MEVSEFIADLRTALAEDDRAEAWRLCTVHSDIAKENLWDIIPSITAYIVERVEIEEDERFHACVDLLNSLVENCCPEDVVLVLHRELADTKDDSTFIHILPAIKLALMQIPKRRPKYAIWCFSAINGFIKNLPVPDNFNLDEKERILMDTDADVHRIATIYAKVWEFYEEIIGEFKDVPIVVKYVLSLYGSPLVHLDLKLFRNNDTWTKSAGRRIMENFTEKVSQMCNPMRFLTWRKYKVESDEDLEVNLISLMNFYYLLLAECAGYVPQVYHPIYVMQNLLHFITEAFLFDAQFIIEKGLDLCDYVLTSTRKIKLDYMLLDDPIHSKFCAGLSRVIIYSPLKSYRQKALAILTKYLRNFDNKGRYLLLLNIFNTVNHSGLMGYLITQYKDMIVEQFKTGDYALDQFFNGAKFARLIKIFCFLHMGEKSDLLELADQIVPALNLLRYLAIRDKNNVTGIWELFPILNHTYLEPLKKGLIMSKAHYELKIKELEEEAATGEKKAKISKVSVSIAGKELPNMAIGEKMNVLRSSMTAFDVIESLLGRLTEFIGDKL